jgi:type I restriction enzyme M protein
MPAMTRTTCWCCCIKYIGGKFAGAPLALITITPGASFKGTSDIGDRINKRIIAPLANVNQLSDFPDFNDAAVSSDGDRSLSPEAKMIAARVGV